MVYNYGHDVLSIKIKFFGFFFLIFLKFLKFLKFIYLFIYFLRIKLNQLLLIYKVSQLRLRVHVKCGREPSPSKLLSR